MSPSNKSELDLKWNRAHFGAWCAAARPLASSLPTAVEPRQESSRDLMFRTVFEYGCQLAAWTALFVSFQIPVVQCAKPARSWCR